MICAVYIYTFIHSFIQAKMPFTLLSDLLNSWHRPLYVPVIPLIPSCGGETIRLFSMLKINFPAAASLRRLQNVVAK